MVQRRPRHKRGWALTSLLIVLCLVFSAIRTTDLSPPGQPKPTRRAVLETKIKESAGSAKKFFTDVSPLPCSAALSPPFWYTTGRTSTEIPSLHHPPLFPHASRAPPASTG
ncbi:hypothetical protein LPW11_01790 [Geomonas sp. RF6]|uniref:hypothetical protein n=1 Tax=Geomonas sp. RF6 TaxID=2897342 RepID=UPI001E4E6AE6|nr:hypothetical protein [Geomonas sp. RF6]UFS70928.1 hypothetical protein LPW11_01790 [Geomonas sp. RF6]